MTVDPNFNRVASCPLLPATTTASHPLGVHRIERGGRVVATSTRPRSPGVTVGTLARVWGRRSWCGKKCGVLGTHVRAIEIFAAPAVRLYEQIHRKVAQPVAVFGGEKRKAKGAKACTCRARTLILGNMVIYSHL
eukprot:COSAG01_NODE_39551_length_475_cov_0.784574_1_plen_135_part_00